VIYLFIAAPFAIVTLAVGLIVVLLDRKLP
jgi:flagellar biosynthesis protein FliQ